jgi:Zn-dependent protease
MMNFDIQQMIVFIVAFAFSISIHEFSHGYSAFLYGDPTAKSMGRLTLNPIKHLDPFGLIAIIFAGFGWAKPVPVNGRYFRKPMQDMMVVSLAGPASNLLLALLCALALKVAPSTSSGSFFYPLIMLVAYLVQINVMLAIFNLIPIPPLDGGHILQGLLPPRYAMEYSKIEPYGFIILLVLVFSGALGFLISPVIGTLNNALMNI